MSSTTRLQFAYCEDWTRAFCIQCRICALRLLWILFYNPIREYYLVSVLILAHPLSSYDPSCYILRYPFKLFLGKTAGLTVLSYSHRVKNMSLYLVWPCLSSDSYTHCHPKSAVNMIMVVLMNIQIVQRSIAFFFCQISIRRSFIDCGWKTQVRSEETDGDSSYN